jgi:flagellar hook-associated protein 1 FlgK
MASNIFSASLSGMNAAQYGLSTTQHNIANANTPGYTRQTMMVNSRESLSTGAGFVGQGVNVAGVVRSYDEFLTGQVRQVQSQASYLTSYLSSMTQVDSLVSNTASGVSTAIQGFFNAMNGLANSPESIPARQTVLSTAQSAINSFQAMDQSLTDISNGLTGKIAGSVQTVNTYATQIASLNTTIKTAIAASNGQQPNDLLDQRDQLVNLLNKEMKVTVQQQSDGSMNVFIGNGQALVVGDKSMGLQVVQNPNDPSKVDIAYTNNATTTTIQQSSLQGGNLGAYLNFRDLNLEPARNALGRVALGMAASINQQNQLGQDLNGAPGGTLLLAAAPRVVKGANNTGTAAAIGTISNVSALTTSDYLLKFDGTNYSLTRMADNIISNLGSTLVPPPVVDGFSVGLTTGTMNAGDSFLIRPTANAARDITLTTSDPAKIATALPYRSTAAISATSATAITTVASGLITASAVTVAGTTPTTDAFTVDGKTLFTNTLAAGAVGPLITAANLDAAWPAFAAANPGYTLTGTFALGTAQITKAGGAAITLAETQTAGTGATLTPLVAAGAGFMGVTPGSTVDKVGGITVAVPANANLNTPVAITFTSPTTYTVTGAVPAVAGVQTYTAPNISYNGWTMQLNAAPAAGDVFNVAANSGAAKVNSGAINLNPVSISFTSATAYTVVEMRGVPPAPVTLGTGLIPPAVGGSSTVSYNGWTAQITGTPVTGDTFNVSKGSNAGAMQLNAAATNTAGAAISGGAFSVLPFAIRFNNPPTSYTVSGATPAVAVSVPYVAGQDISYNGWTMQVTGTPRAGDVFNVGANTNATGDNRNALLMAGQQTQNLMVNGTTSLQGAFSQLVGSVGAKTQELTITSQAQDAMVTQTVATQQSISGVNLDEEAANLLRYQRAYQAAAKAMQIANTMFDSLLNLGR